MHERKSPAGPAQRLWLSVMALILAACCAVIGQAPSLAHAATADTLHVHYQFYRTDPGYIEDLIVFDVPAADDGLTFHIPDDERRGLADAASWRVMKNFAGGIEADEEDITEECEFDAAAGTLAIPQERRGEDISLVVQLPWNSAAHGLKEGFDPLANAGGLVRMGVQSALKGSGLGLSAQASGNSGVGSLDIGVEYPLRNIVSVYNAGTTENSPHIDGVDSSNNGGGASHGYPEHDSGTTTRYGFYVAFEPNNSELFEICGVPGRQGTGTPIYGSTGTPYDQSWNANFKWCFAHCVQAVYNGGGAPVPVAGPGSWVRIDSVSGNTVNCTFRISCNGPTGDDYQDIMGTFSLDNPKGNISLHKESANSAISNGNALFGLHGISYGVFSNSECTDQVAAITLDSNGNGIAENLQAGQYWVKETSSGRYFMDDQAYAVTVTGGQTAEVNGGTVYDAPGTVAANLLLSKIDSDARASSPQGDASLADARFSVKYFDNLDGSVSGSPKRSWLLKTDASGKVTLDSGHFVSGDDLYRDSSGNPVLPYGTYLITETTAPAGYRLPQEGSRTVVLGKENSHAGDATYEPFDQVEEVVRGGFMIGKGDAGRHENGDGAYYNYAQGDATLAGAEFTVYNDSAGRVMVGGSWFDPGAAVMTIATSYNRSLDAYVASTGEKALPYGTYRVVETKAPEGYRKEGTIEKTVRITEEGQFTQLVRSEGMLDEIVLGGVKVEKRDAELGASEATGGSGHAAPGTEGYRGTTLAGIEFTVTNASEHGVCVGGEWFPSGEVVTTILTQWDEGEAAYIAKTASELLPYGTYTVQETATNDCYLLTDGAPRTFKVRNHGETVAADANGAGLLFSDLVARHDMHLQKKVEGTQAKLAHVPFLITNVTTGEAHVAVTDRNGVINTAASWIKHTANTNANDGLASMESVSSSDVAEGSGIWFGLGEDGSVSSPDDTRGALPYGDYTIRELRCEANAGYMLWEDTFAIDRDTTQTPFDVDLGTVYNQPGEIIGTQASDSSTGTNSGSLSDRCQLVDNVRYENVSVGKEYEIVGTLMNRATGEPVTVEGEPVTATSLFTPTTSSGSTKVRFDLDSSSLAGTPTVVFERMYESGVLVATHEDLHNAGQSIDFPPSIGTNAADKSDGDRFVTPSGKQTIVDSVSYEGLTPGEEYTVVGTLMDPSTSRPLRIGGETVSVEKTFRPEQASGTVEVEFTFDASKLAGRSTVVFERLSLNGEVIASHENPEDEGQTVRFPSIATSAADKADGDKHMASGGMQAIVDTVSYEGLAPGAEYVLEGTLMDVSTGEPVALGDGAATATAAFVPEEGSGSTSLEFEIDADALAGKTVVVFERLSSGGAVVATHEVLDDLGQTVVFPAIGTQAVDKETKTSSVRPDAVVTVVDTVSYSGLIPGKRYLVSGVLVDKSTGMEIVCDGKMVAAEKAFVPQEPAGSIEMEFTFSTAGLASEQKLVAFERVECEGSTVAVHADINDEKQTVIVTERPTPSKPDEPAPSEPKTVEKSEPQPTAGNSPNTTSTAKSVGRPSSLAKTGDGSSLLLLIVLGIMLGGTFAAVYALQRPLRRRDGDE